MDGNSSPRKPQKKFTVELKFRTLGLRPGIYNVIESNKGYRLWIKRGVWIGLPRELVEGDTKTFKPKIYNQNDKYIKSRRAPTHI